MIKLFRLGDKRHKYLTFLAMFFFILQSVAEMGIAIGFSKVLDQMKETDWTEFWIWVVLIGVFCLLTFGFAIAATTLGCHASLRITQNIRHAMFSNIQKLSFIDVDKITTSSLITRITNDTQKYQLTLQSTITTLVRSPIMLVGGIILSMIISWKIALIVIGILILMSFIAIVVIGKRAIPNIVAAQADIDQTAQVVRENALGVRVIKSFCLQDQQKKQFKKVNDDLLNHSTKAWIYFLLVFPYINVILNTVTVSILWVGGWFFQKGIIKKPSDLFLLINVIMIVIGSIIGASMAFVNIMRTQPSVKRIQEVLDLRSSLRNCNHPINLSKNTNWNIEFKNVNLNYGMTNGNDVLKHITFKIKQNQRVGIIGLTGSGKSSLVGLIARLYDASSGQIFIGDHDIRNLDLDQLRDYIGIVLQENYLFSGTIKTNLQFGKSNATDVEIKEALEIACADDFVQHLDKKEESRVEQYAKNFSGGQKQRLAIARTIIKKPKILIFDDSTSALDMATESKLLENINQKMPDTTTIIVAQRISSIKNCDFIIVMDQGKISAIGTHSELGKTNEIYQQIIKSQLQVKEDI